MALVTENFLLDSLKTKSGYFTESNLKTFAAERLIKAANDFQHSDKYDIFLSHSYQDAKLISALRDVLKEKGFTVYVDWIEDGKLDRSKVTSYTALVLRNRMKCCKCLLYATSDAAGKSVWMPWELGYMDSRTRSRVAVAPIVKESNKHDEFRGREYLGIYPYLDLTGDAFFIHENKDAWVNLRDWIAGSDPTKRNG